MGADQRTATVSRRRGDGQDGAVIVEFAAVFIVFTILVAGLVTYGMVFAVQQSLEHAAAEATRSVVGVTDEADAHARIQQVLDEQLGWLGGIEGSEGGAWVEQEDWGACGGDCLALEVRYRGSLLSLMPFRFAAPDELGAGAVLHHDLREGE